MAEKRKYWIKIEKDFLKSSQVRVIKVLPEGKDYVLFYLALMLESIETAGHLRFSESVPYSNEMLAAVTEINVEIVRSAMKIFEEIGLVEILEDGTIFVPIVAPNTTGDECASAQRVRDFRNRKRSALHCNRGVTKCNAHKEKEKEKQKQEEKQKEKEIEKQEEEEVEKEEERHKQEEEESFVEIIDYLNLLCKTNYRLKTQKTRRLIADRFADGFTVEDFKTVIAKKHMEWHDTDMEQYLRPETLFGGKFEGYLNAPYVQKKETKSKAQQNQDVLFETLFGGTYDETGNSETFGNELQLLCKGGDTTADRVGELCVVQYV